MNWKNRWTRTLSFGLATFGGFQSLHAQTPQGMVVPGPSAPGNNARVGSNPDVEAVMPAGFLGAPCDSPNGVGAGHYGHAGGGGSGHFGGGLFSHWGMGGGESLGACGGPMDPCGLSGMGGCGSCGPTGCSGACGGLGACGGGCGPMGCGLLGGGMLGHGGMMGHGGMLGHGGMMGHDPSMMPGGAYGMMPPGYGSHGIDDGLFCGSCGQNGCFRCGWGLGLLVTSKLHGLLAGMAPYSEAGLAAQRWFDVAVDSTWWGRSKGAANYNFSSQGAGTGNYVLSSNSVDLNGAAPGLGVIVNCQVGAGSNLEAVYQGLNQWEESAVATSTPAGTPTLFSFMSDFGTDPLNGYDDPDRSFQHRLDYKSEIHNGEANFRRRWVGRYGWLQGSSLMGLRYIDLDESMTFSARGENNDTFASNGLRFFDYNTGVRNSLMGFQVGGDIWLNIIPGINSGVEMKMGVFGNRADLNSSIVANSISGLFESDESSRTAYAMSFSSTTVYRLTHSWALRGGYQLLYIDNVALAAENFNNAPPALIQPGSNRITRINNDAEVIYDGGFFGAEYTW